MTIQLSGIKFILGCCLLSVIVLVVGYFYTLPPALLAVEVFITVISLFVFGSIRYRLDKNALTYGAGLVISATFLVSWWEKSQLKQSLETDGPSALFVFFSKHFLSMHGLNELIHADTLLFILGLTFFVAVIAQTRLLEAISFSVLNKTRGNVVLTIAIITAVVSFSSGILDGVSMIGLTIRVLVMILFLARIKDKSVIYLVMVSTIVTTVCGMWLAYGEPPNLIMKANLHPYLDNAFFLRYCLPVAVGSYLIVTWNLSRKLRGKKVNINDLDILDLHSADVRFLQASRHGEVLIATEFVDFHKKELGEHYEPIEKRLHAGEPLGLALINESVAVNVRKNLLGKFISENLADELDNHYKNMAEGRIEDSEQSLKKIRNTLRSMRSRRQKAQIFGALAFVPFVGLLVWHAIDHSIPLFFASFAGFLVAFMGIYSITKMKKLALREAFHEYEEYLFLIPLFFSITLLQKAGFFNQLSDALHHGIAQWGPANVAYIQFTGATFLSAILDNNIVADFSSRALHGLEIGIMHLFAMAQIAGFASGGCWTHIGSAQSVVAYSFIKREVDPDFTPFEWIKTMTPIILEIFVLMTLVVYGEAYLMNYLN